MINLDLPHYDDFVGIYLRLLSIKKFCVPQACVYSGFFLQSSKGTTGPRSHEGSSLLFLLAGVAMMR